MLIYPEDRFYMEITLWHPLIPQRRLLLSHCCKGNFQVQKYDGQKRTPLGCVL